MYFEKECIKSPSKYINKDKTCIHKYFIIEFSFIEDNIVVALNEVKGEIEMKGKRQLMSMAQYV